MSERQKRELNERIGRTLAAGKYKLLRLIGAGGMGAVYEAENLWTRRHVAIKLMLGEAAENAQAAARFLREAQATTRISHPNIIDVLDMGREPDDGALYIVVEYLTGGDLRQRLAKKTSLPLRNALEILVPIVDALVAAHRHGIIHRDLKPENIFLATTAAGATVPKLIDFGISKVVSAGRESLALTRTGTMLGTPYYMSPEQARGERTVSAQTDIWAIGVVFYETLTGRSPFAADNYNALMVQILTGEVPRLTTLAPDVPEALADVIHRALDRDRSRRFESMADFLAGILACEALKDIDWHQDLQKAYRASLNPQETPREESPPFELPTDPDEDGLDHSGADTINAASVSAETGAFAQTAVANSQPLQISDEYRQSSKGRKALDPGVLSPISQNKTPVIEPADADASRDTDADPRAGTPFNWSGPHGGEPRRKWRVGLASVIAATALAAVVAVGLRGRPGDAHMPAPEAVPATSAASTHGDMLPAVPPRAEMVPVQAAAAPITPATAEALAIPPTQEAAFEHASADQRDASTGVAAANPASAAAQVRVRSRSNGTRVRPSAVSDPAPVATAAPVAAPPPRAEPAPIAAPARPASPVMMQGYDQPP